MIVGIAAVPKILLSIVFLPFSYASPHIRRKKLCPKPAKMSKDNVDQAAIDVLVDNIIVLLEYSSAYTRALANQTFAMVTPEVQGSTIDLILAVSQS